MVNIISECCLEILHYIVLTLIILNIIHQNHSSLLPSTGFFAIEKVGNTIIFYGGGWGHGVGMSQYGARIR